MKINHVRIDGRLIHGQVAASWVKLLNSDAILVVSDNLKDDKLRSGLVKMACPGNVKLKICDTKEFISIYAKGAKSNNILLIVEDVETMFEIHKSGIIFSEINFAGLYAAEGKVKYERALNLSDSEKEMMIEMTKTIEDCYYQPGVIDNKVNLKKYFEVA